MSNVGSYVCAATPSFCKHVDMALKDNPNHIDAKSVNNFLHNNVNKFLSSYGVALDRGKEVTPNLNVKYQKVFNQITSKEYMDGIQFIIDSGGYQVQTGYIHKDDTNKMIDLYHQFLSENHERFKYAFLLDLAPGSTSCIYDTWKEMEDYNYISYTKAGELPKELRDKMMYIHHFRTPKINDLWNRMLFDDGLADNFQNFATGGLVSFSGGSPCPIVLYIIPLCAIVKYALDRGLKKFKFHVLGSSEWKDILFHKFAQYHIRKQYGLDIEITYDSSTIFKILAMGRYTFIPNWETAELGKMTVRSDQLHKIYRDNYTHEDIFYKFVNEATVPYGMKEINPITEPLYNEGSNLNTAFGTQKTGSFSSIAYIYGIFQILKLFNEVDKYSNHIVEKIYPLYESGDVELFEMEIGKVLKGFNDGKSSKKLNRRIGYVYNSLKELEQLDLDKCNYYVNEYLANDECKKFTKDANLIQYF